MGPLGGSNMTGVLIRRGRDTKAIYALRDNHVRTEQQEGGQLQDKERGLEQTPVMVLGENQLCWHLDLGLLASRTMRK